MPYTPTDGAYKDSPILNRIYSQLEGETYRPLGRYNPIPKDTALGERYAYSENPYPHVNAKIENVAQRVNKEWMGNQGTIRNEYPDTNTIVNKLFQGKEEIERNEAKYYESGLLKHTPSTMDEARYQASAKLLVHMCKQKQKEREQGDDEGNGFAPGHSDHEFSSDPEDHSEFIEYIQSMRWWFDLVNENVKDITFDDPQSRKQVPVENPEGKRTRAVNLDMNRLSQANSEFYMNMATDATMFLLDLEQNTMTQRYDVESYKYIELLLVDQSGSMGGDRIIRAAAYIYNRLDRVKRGISLCAILGFDTSAHTKEVPHDLMTGEDSDKPRWLIDNKVKANYMQQRIIDEYARKFRGGGTNIPAGVIHAYELAKQMEKWNGIKPTVTVITDDDDSILGLSYDRVEGLTINCLALSNNDAMRTATVRTGGKYYSLEDIDLNIEGRL